MNVFRRILRRRSDAEALRRSGRFAADWYRSRYLSGNPAADPVRHYLDRGAALGHAPHPLFDPRWYLARYPDVGASGRDPFVHYLAFGMEEDRAPNAWFDPRWYRRHGGAHGFEPLSGAEATHPSLGPHFAAAPGTCPLADLAAFIAAAAAGQAVGVVELRTQDFVSGWFTPRDAGDYLEIVADGRPGAVAHFNPRPDIAVRIGRSAEGFLFAFTHPPAEGAEVDVRFPGGASLHGAPYRHGGRQSPSPASAEPAQVHFDSATDALRRRLVEVSGWVRVPEGDATIAIFLDGEAEDVSYTLRTDVIALFDHPFCFGFTFPFDVAAAAARGRTALELAVLVDGRRVEHRAIPFALDPVAPDRPKLNVVMHIPKTAGISLANAISGLPDARALWIYDRGAMTVSDQLAGLSPGAFDDLRFVGGHFPYGIHRRIARPCSYVAFLREPVSYLKSFYLYMKYVARAPDFAGGDLRTMLAHRHEFDNAFTRWFATVPAERAVDEADLARALAAMERDFAFVGLVERMEESIARLSRLWGVDLPVLRDNRTPPIPEAATIDLGELAREAEANVRFDRALHARAQALFWT